MCLRIKVMIWKWWKTLNILAKWNIRSTVLSLVDFGGEGTCVYVYSAGSSPNTANLQVAEVDAFDAIKLREVLHYIMWRWVCAVR